MKKRLTLVLFLLALLPVTLKTISQNRWTMLDDGGIVWDVNGNDAHTDHIELSGKQLSVILTYGVDTDGILISNKQLIFPMLRTIPNNTHGHLMYTFGQETSPVIRVNGRIIQEKAWRFYLKGLVKSFSETDNQVSITRVFSPSVDKAFP